MGITIHKIAEAAESLSQDQRWCQYIRQTQDRDLLPMRKPQDGTNATDHPPMKRQPPAPDRRNLPEELAIERPIKHHIVEPGADNPREHRQEKQISLIVVGEGQSLTTDLRTDEKDGRDNAHDIHQP